MNLIGCINRSRGQKLGLQNAIFKNLIVWKYKANSFHIWCKTHYLEVLYQYLVDNISSPLLMAPLWPLTFSSGERPLLLAQLSTKCSGWAIVTSLCLLSVVVRRPSCENFLAHLSTKCSRWAFVMAHCPSSIVCPSVRPCVNNFFQQHLLWNRLLDFDQTSQEWSLGGPLSKLFKPFQLVA